MGRYSFDEVNYPIKWIMIYNDADKKEGLMLSEKILEKTTFQSVGAGYYPNSDLYYIMQRLYNNDLRLSEIEKKIIKDTTLDKESMCSDVSSLLNQKFFPLSKEEMENYVGNKTYLGKGYSHIDNITEVPCWWSRSSHNKILTYSTWHRGATSYNIVYLDNGGIRPAFNLDMESILFTSDSMLGKSGEVGVLGQVGYNVSNEWKMTIKDSEHKLISAIAQDDLIADTTININYNGASIGHRLSAMIIDKNTKDIINYGTIDENIENVNGTVKIVLPSNFNATMHEMLMFTETINGDKETDLASEMIPVNIL